MLKLRTLVKRKSQSENVLQAFKIFSVIVEKFILMWHNFRISMNLCHISYAFKSLKFKIEIRVDSKNAPA